MRICCCGFRRSAGGEIAKYASMRTIVIEKFDVGCGKDKAENVECVFTRHYIYDPSKKVEYVE